jgi:hypothetical protein
MDDILGEAFPYFLQSLYEVAELFHDVTISYLQNDR